MTDRPLTSNQKLRADEARDLLERAHSILLIREAAMQTAKGQALLGQIAGYLNERSAPETPADQHALQTAQNNLTALTYWVKQAAICAGLMPAEKTTTSLVHQPAGPGMNYCKHHPNGRTMPCEECT